MIPTSASIPTMKDLPTIGRFLLAIAILAFGFQHLIFASTGSGFGPPWTPVNHLLAYVAGILLIVAGAAFVTGKQVWIAAMIVAAVSLVRAALYYDASFRKPGPWTSAFELLAIAGTSMMLVASLIPKRALSDRAANLPGLAFQTGNVFFAAALVVFGIQHLMYGAFVATLIPAWMPGHLFWAYFVGIAFIATALAILSGKLAQLAANLLGTMFLLWVLILHAPRVALALHNSDEWTSLLVALAMSGSAFVIAGTLQPGMGTGHAIRR